MLLLNGEQFIPTSKKEDQRYQRSHYKESIEAIRKEYSQGGRNQMIMLSRRKDPKRTATGTLEETAPLVFPAKAYVEIQFSSGDRKDAEKLGGIETWAYSANQPLKKPNGGDWDPVPKSIKFMSHAQGFNLITEIDLIYFLLYKSSKVYHPQAIAQGKAKKGDLIVVDRAHDAKVQVARERDILKLKNAIMAPDVSFPLYSDENLRKVAAAWGLDGALDEYESVDDIRLRLEHNVKEAEKTKAISRTGKGVAEFLAMINFDDSVRQRAMLMYAIDKKKIEFSKEKTSYLYKSGSILLEVPDKHKYEPFDYLAGEFEKELNKKKWGLLKKEIIDIDYLESLKFDDLKWLAKEGDLKLYGKGADALKQELVEVYCG